MGRLRFNLLLFALLLVGGCVPIHKKGTTHYLVFGFGVVSVNSTNRTVATVVRANVIGVVASGRGLKAGYSAETSVSIGTNENIVIEVKQAPFKSLNVCVPSLH
jgi:hypothetical protein